MIFTVYLLVFVFGLVIGSFINCLVWRLHKKQTILGRSYCPHCKHQLAWHDNIPLFSFIFLRGRCRYCAKPISMQYPAVELMTGLLFMLAFYHNFQFEFLNFNLISNSKFPIINFLSLIRDWFLISVMVIIFIYDLRWYLILDVITLPSIALVLILNFFINLLSNDMALSDSYWQQLLISVIIGAGFFLLQFVISKGRWIGGGDIRLGLLMGVALGWPDILVALFIAYLAGAIIGIGLILIGKKKWGSEIPFGIFLSAATLVTLFFGNFILDWYLNMLA
ncbi:MAG: Type 4 prepilin-like protein leader peptide-processing enzyme [Parcubacteria group bacterium GW2011_GWE2_38_18]|nr:MAG: Type 4 prepilin-like protein leader peptide-processing enzyme [Parcubacteria group bacterium GW2011_GWE2_38_18]